MKGTDGMFDVEVDAPGVNSPPLPFPFTLGDSPAPFRGVPNPIPTGLPGNPPPNELRFIFSLPFNDLEN